MAVQSKKNKFYVVAISICRGIITLLEPDGRINRYRQRGMKRVEPILMNRLVLMGKVDRMWESYPELPSNYSISFEDEEIMGKARATFNPNKL